MIDLILAHFLMVKWQLQLENYTQKGGHPIKVMPHDIWNH